MPNKELEFRRRLARELSSPPYCHKVYFHESPNEFSIRGARGWVDLYCETNPRWPHHDKFPVLGIETKVSTSLGWLIDAIEQVHKYSDDLARATYAIAGRQVPQPSLFLVATPESWEEGVLYKWCPPELTSAFSLFDPDYLAARMRGNLDKGILQTITEALQRGCWFGLTELYNRILWKHGAALLQRGGFYTNMHGNCGGGTKYSLITEQAEAA